MPISELQRNTPADARGPELSKWMEVNGVRVDRARIPEWLERERKKDDDRARKKGKP